MVTSPGLVLNFGVLEKVNDSQMNYLSEQGTQKDAGQRLILFEKQKQILLTFDRLQFYLHLHRLVSF